jgi:hypothetical protein
MPSSYFFWPRIVYVLLILSAGILGPLTYFDAYSPHRVANTYHLTILQDPAHISRLFSTLQAIRQNRTQSSANWTQNHIPAISNQFAIPLSAKILKFATDNAYYSEMTGAHLQACLIWRIWDDALALSSAFIPPPDKPPTV